MPTSIQKTLLSMGEEGYRDFQSRLMPSVNKGKIIGIRTPLLRKYAKGLTNYQDFLESLPHKYYEEDNLHAFLVERETDFDTCIRRLDAFLPHIDNWATCDSLNPKILKTESEKLLLHIKRWIKSRHTYTVRFGIKLLMTYYSGTNFRPEYPHMVSAVISEEYYINMMRAWYFATLLATNHEEILPFFEDKSLDKWTHNKAIQKARESFRIPNEQKEYLQTLKI